jgi:hypothetical protein
VAFISLCCFTCRKAIPYPVLVVADLLVLAYERAANSMYVGSMILDILLNSSYGAPSLYMVAGHGRIGVPKVSKHTGSAPLITIERHINSTFQQLEPLHA